MQAANNIANGILEINLVIINGQTIKISNGPAYQNFMLNNRVVVEQNS